MLTLANTTLVCVDTVHPDLSLYALRRCMIAAQFERVILFGNSGTHVDDGIELIPVNGRVRSAADYSSFIVNELPDHISSDWVLIVQWDGFILNPEVWTNEFLEYDYIGAPWPNLVPSVGNGGFSLRSRRLMKVVKSLQIPDPHPEDVRIAVDYGEILGSKYGIRFAPVTLAQRFSFEGTYSEEPSFGFHCIYNFHLALEPDELREWLVLAPADVLLSQFGQDLALRMYEAGRGSEAWPILLAAMGRELDIYGNALWHNLWRSMWSKGSLAGGLLESLESDGGAIQDILKAVERQVATADERTAQAEERTAQADAALRAVLISRSWRMTEPLRRLDDSARLAKAKTRSLLKRLTVSVLIHIMRLATPRSKARKIASYWLGKLPRLESRLQEFATARGLQWLDSDDYSNQAASQRRTELSPRARELHLQLTAAIDKKTGE